MASVYFACGGGHSFYGPTVDSAPGIQPACRLQVQASAVRPSAGPFEGHSGDARRRRWLPAASERIDPRESLSPSASVLHMNDARQTDPPLHGGRWQSNWSSLRHLPLRSSRLPSTVHSRQSQSHTGLVGVRLSGRCSTSRSGGQVAFLQGGRSRRSRQWGKPECPRVGFRLHCTAGDGRFRAALRTSPLLEGGQQNSPCGSKHLLQGSSTDAGATVSEDASVEFVGGGHGDHVTTGGEASEVSRPAPNAQEDIRSDAGDGADWKQGLVWLGKRIAATVLAAGVVAMIVEPALAAAGAGAVVPGGPQASQAASAGAGAAAGVAAAHAAAVGASTAQTEAAAAVAAATAGGAMPVSSVSVVGSMLEPVVHYSGLGLSAASAIILHLFQSVFSRSDVAKAILRALIRHPFAPVLPATILMASSIWLLGPVLKLLHKAFSKDKESWEDSRVRYIMASYVRPLLLWISISVIVRTVQPMVLPSASGQLIKDRFLNFARALTTVLVFAFCTANLIREIQKRVEKSSGMEQERNVGIQFVGNAVYTLVWVAAVFLFMELLGFSTQKWITAGGFGTVLVTLAAREIVTNFLSSVMIHAARPFMVNEWIVCRIDGQEVSGTVEHVGWWEPTLVRGDDKEAIHIPNHKFTVNVIRNMSQRTHWRIKTYFGVCHMDAGKVPEIVLGMRKVVARQPQIEQRHLHRRVYVERVDQDLQAIMIMISIFVKTPHFEEYLRVKELVVLDLLKVVYDCGARLATPIRSVQRLYDEAEGVRGGYQDEEDEEEEEDDEDEEMTELSRRLRLLPAVAAGLQPEEAVAAMREREREKEKEREREREKEQEREREREREKEREEEERSGRRVRAAGKARGQDEEYDDEEWGPSEGEFFDEEEYDSADEDEADEEEDEQLRELLEQVRRMRERRAGAAASTNGAGSGNGAAPGAPKSTAAGPGAAAVAAAAAAAAAAASGVGLASPADPGKGATGAQAVGAPGVSPAQGSSGERPGTKSQPQQASASASADAGAQQASGPSTIIVPPPPPSQAASASSDDEAYPSSNWPRPGSASPSAPAPAASRASSSGLKPSLKAGGMAASTSAAGSSARPGTSSGIPAGTGAGPTPAGSSMSLSGPGTRQVQAAIMSNPSAAVSGPAGQAPPAQQGVPAGPSAPSAPTRGGSTLSSSADGLPIPPGQAAVKAKLSALGIEPDWDAGSGGESDESEVVISAVPVRGEGTARPSKAQDAEEAKAGRESARAEGGPKTVFFASQEEEVDARLQQMKEAAAAAKQARARRKREKAAAKAAAAAAAAAAAEQQQQQQLLLRQQQGQDQAESSPPEVGRATREEAGETKNQADDEAEASQWAWGNESLEDEAAPIGQVVLGPQGKGPEDMEGDPWRKDEESASAHLSLASDSKSSSDLPANQGDDQASGVEELSQIDSHGITGLDHGLASQERASLHEARPSAPVLRHTASESGEQSTQETNTDALIPLDEQGSRRDPLPAVSRHLEISESADGARDGHLVDPESAVAERASAGLVGAARVAIRGDEESDDGSESKEPLAAPGALPAGTTSARAAAGTASEGAV